MLYEVITLMGIRHQGDHLYIAGQRDIGERLARIGGLADGEARTYIRQRHGPVGERAVQLHGLV